MGSDCPPGTARQGRCVLTGGARKVATTQLHYPLERWLALFDERFDPFLPIWMRTAVANSLSLQLQLSFQGCVERIRHQLFRPGKRMKGCPTQAVEHCNRLRKHVIIRHNLSHQSPLQRLRGGDRLVERHNLHGACQADETRQSERSAAIDAESARRVCLSQAR